MHRLATVHARDNQPTNDQPTNDQRRHDTAYLNKRLFYQRKVRRLKNQVISSKTLVWSRDQQQRSVFLHYAVAD